MKDSIRYSKYSIPACSISRKTKPYTYTYNQFLQKTGMFYSVRQTIQTDSVLVTECGSVMNCLPRDSRYPWLVPQTHTSIDIQSEAQVIGLLSCQDSTNESRPELGLVQNLHTRFLPSRRFVHTTHLQPQSDCHRQFNLSTTLNPSTTPPNLPLHTDKMVSSFLAVQRSKVEDKEAERSEWRMSCGRVPISMENECTRHGSS